MQKSWPYFFALPSSSMCIGVRICVILKSKQNKRAARPRSQICVVPLFLKRNSQLKIRICQEAECIIVSTCIVYQWRLTVSTYALYCVSITNRLIRCGVHVYGTPYASQLRLDYEYKPLYHHRWWWLERSIAWSFC